MWRTRGFKELSEIQAALIKALDSIPTKEEGTRLSLKMALNECQRENETIHMIVQKLHHKSEGYTDKPVPGKPASKELIIRLEEKFEERLPEDYRGFLCTWGGYKNLMHCTFFAPEEILNPGRKAKAIDCLIEKMTKYVENLHVLVIGIHHPSEKFLLLCMRQGYTLYTIHHASSP